MRRDYDKYLALDAELLVIGHQDMATCQAYFRNNELPFPGLVDEAYSVYQQFDVQSKAVSLGQRPGLFIIDKAGTVRFAYVGWQQWEIPPNNEVLEMLEGMQ